MIDSNGNQFEYNIQKKLILIRLFMLEFYASRVQ